MTITHRGLISLRELKKIVYEKLPKEALITEIEVEGPLIVVYCKNPRIFFENENIIKEVAKTVRKRIVIRSDPSIILDKAESLRIIREVVPAEAEISDVYFDDVTGEVIIEVKNPTAIARQKREVIKEIFTRTYWRPIILRRPPLTSEFHSKIVKFLMKESKYRKEFLQKVGFRIRRQALYLNDNIRLVFLGGFQEVGRSAILLQTGESNVLIDCGVKVGTNVPQEAYPRLDYLGIDIDELDAVIVSHAHLDHAGFVPYLFKYGYDGPVYCTKPTLSLMVLLQTDYLDVLKRSGTAVPYSTRDIKKMVLHTITLNYDEVTDITPDIHLTFHPSGHILGSAMVHLHIGEGLHNILYTGDFKSVKTRLLEPCRFVFPRLETLVMESTYGSPSDIMPSRMQSEQLLLQVVQKTLDRGGKVLMPVLSVGRAQEIMMILEEAIRNKKIPETYVYTDGMLVEAIAIHTAYPEYLSKELREKILEEGVNPFMSEYFIRVDYRGAREDIVEGGPAIIMATSGMLTGGPAVEYFRLLCGDKRNSVIFTSYLLQGTLGYRLVHGGLKEVAFTNSQGRYEVYKVNAEIYSIEGFSGHSDFNQLMLFLRRIRPKPHKIIIGHGERIKSQQLANSIFKTFGIKAEVPANLDALRIL